MIKNFYLSAMIMEAINAILNVSGKLKCPICGHSAEPLTKQKAGQRTLHLVCSNEYYTHYQWAGHHYLVREAPSEILESISLC